MNLHSVLEEKENYTYIFLNIRYDLLLFTLVFLFLASLVIVYVLIPRDTGGNSRKANFILLIASASIPILIFSGISLSKQYNKEKDIWKEDYAIPYIKQSGEIVEEISKYKIVEPFENHSLSQEQSILSKGFTYSENYSTVELRTKTSLIKVNAIIKEDLKENEQPYITYYLLKDDLDINIRSGHYDVVLHLPKDKWKE